MLESGLPDIVDGEEPIARFLTSSRLFNASGVVKAAAFMPNPNYQNTSVYRRGEIDLLELWEIAGTEMGERNVHGAAFCTAEKVRNTGLDVEAEEPPPYHANIVKWPFCGSDPMLDKAKRKELAAEIARESSMKLR